MRTRKFELLRPEELKEEREKNSLIYLPVGPLEWHSYGMPMGTDGIAAQKACLEAAKQTGGVVLPVFYCATPLVRKDGRTEMEPADSCAKSIFFPGDIFAGMIKGYLKAIAAQGYKKIVIVAGHGSEGFTDVMEDLCKEISGSESVTAVLTHAWATQDTTPYSLGHATILEASMMMHLTESVKISQWPDESEKLNCLEMGIDDPDEENGFVSDINDPRKATAALGKKIFDIGIRNLVDFVKNL